MTPDDGARLLDMFSTMSDEALEWGMPPYTRETVDRWMSNLDRLMALIAVFEERIIGYVTIYKQPHPRRSGVADMGIYCIRIFMASGWELC